MAVQTGTTGPDFFGGTPDDDEISVLAGNDSVLGDAGNDVIYGGDDNDTLDGKADDDIVYGGDGEDTVLGGGGTDSVYGDEGDDFVSGGGGDDFIDGGIGTDTVLLGALDRYDFNATFNADGTVASLEAVDTAGSGIFGTDTIVNVELLQFGAGTPTFEIDSFFALLFDNGTFVDGFESTQEAVDNAVAGNTIRVGEISNVETVTVDKSLEFVGTQSDDELEFVGAFDIVIDGDAGNDQLFSGNGNDTIFGGAGDDSVLGNSGQDVIYGGDDNDILDGKADDDVVYGGSGEDTVLGGGGSDSIFGNGGSDFVSGGGGDDSINGGSGTDTVLLGALDRYDFNLTVNANGRVTLLEAIDTAPSGIFGTDTIVNVELLQFGAGTEAFNLGRFFALVSDNGTVIDGFESTQEAVDNAVAGNTVRVGEISTAETVTVDKSLEFVGTRQDDELEFLGAFDLSIDGDRGSDLLFSGDGDDTIFGGAGDDSVLGNIGGDVIYGGGNNDILDGKADDDMVYGGSGADTVLGGGGTDSLFGDGGSDFVSGGGGDDFMDGGRGTDTAFFGALSRYSFDATFDARGRVTSLEAVDTASNPIFGTDTAVNFERLQFGSTGEVLDINSFLVRLFDGRTFVDGFESVQEAVDSSVAGNTIRLGTISDSAAVTVDKDLRFVGTAEDDTLEVTGTARVNINGGNGSDNLTGGDANDRLTGGDGDDNLTGGLGRDVHSGGTGSDTFFFAEGDGGASNSRADLIIDFDDGVDFIGLTDGLEFADLTIGTLGADALVSVTATGEVLVRVRDAAGDLDDLDFV